MAVSIIALDPLQLLTSLPSATAFPPAWEISLTTCCAGEVSVPLPSRLPPRSLTTTFAPWAANMSAYWRPMPRPAPVTSTTRPSHNFAISCLRNLEEPELPWADYPIDMVRLTILFGLPNQINWLNVACMASVKH